MAVSTCTYQQPTTSNSACSCVSLSHFSYSFEHTKFSKLLYASDSNNRLTLAFWSSSELIRIHYNSNMLPFHSSFVAFHILLYTCIHYNLHQSYKLHDVVVWSRIKVAQKNCVFLSSCLCDNTQWTRPHRFFAVLTIRQGMKHYLLAAIPAKRN